MNERVTFASQVYNSETGLPLPFLHLRLIIFNLHLKKENRAKKKKKKKKKKRKGKIDNYEYRDSPLLHRVIDTI